MYVFDIFSMLTILTNDYKPDNAGYEPDRNIPSARPEAGKPVI
jgi:hypothetical protein